MTEIPARQLDNYLARIQAARSLAALRDIADDVQHHYPVGDETSRVIALVEAKIRQVYIDR